MIQQIEDKHPCCEKVDIPCAYDDGLGVIYYNDNDTKHRQNRQMYPQILRVRTCVEHRCRLVCLKNLDLHLRGIINGTTLRALPTHSWVGNCVFNRMGKCVGKSKQIDTNNVIADANFTLTVTKDDEATRTKEHRSGHRDFIDIGIATEMSREGSLLGSCVQVPVDLGYAVTIHKGQGLTIRKVHALLEGLFAHGSCMCKNHAHLSKDILLALEFHRATYILQSYNA